MIEKTKWIDRDFKTDDRSKLFPNIVERLRGTPARLEDKLKNISINRLVKKIDSAWSVQEHSGHLLDLEYLHLGRLDDFANRLETLRAADMTNKKTNEANHNNHSLSTILQAFREQRLHICDRLDKLTYEEITALSIHPRINRAMTIVDLIVFFAEHDDHHLSSIQTLLMQTERK